MVLIMFIDVLDLCRTSILDQQDGLHVPGFLLRKDFGDFGGRSNTGQRAE
jgi:hypothetical protein